jgi:YD repeat-containing protein
MLKELRPLGNSLEYQYDPAGRLLQRTESMGWQVKYLYSDKTGRLGGYMLKKGPGITAAALSGSAMTSRATWQAMTMVSPRPITIMTNWADG